MALLKTQPEAKVLLLHEGDVRRALVGFGGTARHYAFNLGGARVLLILSGLLLAAAAVIAVVTGAAILPWRAAVVLCVVAALALMHFVWRWRKKASSSFLAYDEEHLFLGDRARAWRISWEALDATSFGLETFTSQSGQGALKLDVGGQSIELLLYHPLMHLDDLQGFIFDVLHKLQGEQVAEAAGEIMSQSDEPL